MGAITRAPQRGGHEQGEYGASATYQHQVKEQHSISTNVPSNQRQHQQVRNK